MFCRNKEHLCIRIDATTLIDRTKELVPESKNELHEAQTNLTEAIEDPNQSSKEPNANFTQEGKPWCI